MVLGIMSEVSLQGPRHSHTVGSKEEALSYERGAPAHCTGVPRKYGHPPSPGNSYAPRHEHTVGPKGGAYPYSRVIPVLRPGV